MSIYENSIQAFIDVIESGLIATPDWAELNQLASNLPEETDEIAEEIENWLQPEYRCEIRQAYEERLEALTSSSSIDLLDKNLGLGPGRSISPTKPNQPSQPSRELLINAIQRNSRSSDSPPAKP